MAAKVSFGSFGRETEMHDSEADILLGANFGVAERLGWIERNTYWGFFGATRQKIVTGRSFEVSAFDERLRSLEGTVFKTVADVKAAVRERLAAGR